MKTKQYISIAFTLTLLLLWIPVAIEKLFDFDTFRYAILRQPLPYEAAYTAIYTLPALELLAVVLLVFPQWRRAGFMLSAVLMALFTAYIGLALLGTWDRLPCGCGSVIKGMTWTQHLWFNLFFLGVSVVGSVWERRMYTAGRDAISCVCTTEYNT